MSNLLPMFFDEEFVPHAYLDALFEQSSVSNTSPKQNNLTNLKHIKLLQQRTTMLLSNLDYYTNGLTNDLEEKISTLQQSNSVISYSYDQNNLRRSSAAFLLNKESISSKLKPTTRLEYYIDSLSISINSLNDQIQEISTDINKLSLNSANEDITTKLLKLTKSKENLQKVANSLESIKSITEISESLTGSQIPSTRSAPTNTKSSSSSTISIQPTEFNNSLVILKNSIIEQFKLKAKTESPTEIDEELINKIDSLIELLSIFKNLGQFYSSYSNFVKVLQSEKNFYLENKSVELKDDLFQKILQ